MILAVAIQVAVLGLFGLDRLGIDLPGIRQIIGSFYLCFIPGLLILRILRLRVGIIETILYSVGLSLSLVMFSGALINFLYPLLGISRPISEVSLVISCTVIVLALVLLGYLQDKDYSQSFLLDINKILYPAVLFLLLLPILATLGAFLVNLYDSNILLLFLLATISLIPILVVYDKIPLQILPLAVWTISLALLFHNSLTGNYILGYDCVYEYFLSNLVKTSSIWDPAISNNINAMLSITMFVPIFSVVSNIGVTWVFKIIYPLLLSFVPLGLFRMFREATQDDKIAFFACFFFTSIGEFFGEMLGLTRQGIAMFFITLIGCLTMNKVLKPVINAVVLLITFLFSLAVSHYGTCYLFLLCCMIALFVSYILQTKTRRLLAPGLIILFGVFAISWYIYMSSSSSFITIVNIGNHIISQVGQMFVPEPGSPMAYFTTFGSLSVNISKCSIFK